MRTETKAKAFEHAMMHLRDKREACGVVVIEKGHEIYLPCRNISEFNDNFAIHPQDFAMAEDRGDVVRIIHSHPFGEPRPSDADRVSCEQSGIPWSIVSVPKGEWFDFEPSGYKAPLVGREWMHGVLDCYSLIRDYYQEVLKIEIPDFERDFDWWNRGGNLYAENFQKAGFHEIPFQEIKTHDVILMQVVSPVINHGAVYLGDEKMLHHLHRRLSCREVFGGYWRKHAVKVIRHEKC